MPTSSLPMTESAEPAPYTMQEELANALSHGAGIIFGVVATTLMLASTIPSGDAAQIASVAIYGASMILVFTASTLYHSFHNPVTKARLKIFDHVAIYMLIAGTYTPYLVVSLRGEIAEQMLVLVWCLALMGTAFKFLFIKRFKALSVATYLGMGWLSYFVIAELAAVLDDDGITMLIAGGLCYTVGVIFYINKKIPYNHAIWHLFVLGGAVCHWVSIFNFVLPDWWYKLVPGSGA